MIQFRDGLRFRAKPLHEIGRGKLSRRHHLHRNDSIDLRLPRLVNDAHSAAGHFCQQLVTAKRAGQRCFRARRLRRRIERAVEHRGEKTLRAQPAGGIRGQGAPALGANGGCL